MNIETIDKNMKTNTPASRDGVCYFDVREEPFSLYGFYKPKTGQVFRRLPEDVAAATSVGVKVLASNTAGGRVRFGTDSPFIVLEAEMPQVCLMDHMALTGSGGFDLCIANGDGTETIRGTFRPQVTITDGYSAKIAVGEKKMRYYTVEFPSYSDVSAVRIGLAEGSALTAGLPYRAIPPIVYYGSSITQGACACRPGNAYQNIISQKNNIDFLNLGFSGSGCAEEPIVNYMATLPMSMFVADYDYNAPDADYLYETSVRMYQTIRAAHPDVPYLLVAHPDFDTVPTFDTKERREALRKVYRGALAAGDGNVAYIDGTTVFSGMVPELGTVDGVHPNDLGFYRMAQAIGAEIDRMLG